MPVPPAGAGDRIRTVWMSAEQICPRFLALGDVDPLIEQQLDASLHRRAGTDGCIPARDRRQVVKALVRQLVNTNPGKAGDVGD
jgi:hypothetical protein